MGVPSIEKQDRSWIVDVGGSGIADVPTARVDSDGPIEETKTLRVSGLGSAVTRSTKQCEIPTNLGRFAGQNVMKGIAMELMSPFHIGWIREAVSRQAQANRAEIYYLSPDGTKNLQSSKDAAKYFQNNPHEHLSADNFSWKQKPLGLNDQLFERVRTAKPQSPRG